MVGIVVHLLVINEQFFFFSDLYVSGMATNSSGRQSQN